MMLIAYVLIFTFSILLLAYAYKRHNQELSIWLLMLICMPCGVANTMALYLLEMQRIGPAGSALFGVVGVISSRFILHAYLTQPRWS